MSNFRPSVWIHGMTGKMGICLKNLIERDQTLQLSGGSCSTTNSDALQQGILDSDLIIDFSSASGCKQLVESLLSAQVKNKKLLICSTGMEPTTIQKIKNLSEKNAVLLAPNTSLGIKCLLESTLRIASQLVAEDFDCDIIESHHRHKKDGPSGTADWLASKICEQTGLRMELGTSNPRIKNNLEMHHLRSGGIKGEHTIRFSSEDEEISLTHRAYSRKLFARGAIYYARWLLNQQPGLFQPSHV